MASTTGMALPNFSWAVNLVLYCLAADFGGNPISIWNERFFKVYSQLDSILNFKNYNCLIFVFYTVY